MMEPELVIDRYVVKRTLEELRGYYIVVEIGNLRHEDNEAIVEGEYRRTDLLGILSFEEGEFRLKFDVGAGKPRLIEAHIKPKEEAR